MCIRFVHPRRSSVSIYGLASNKSRPFHATAATLPKHPYGLALAAFKYAGAAVGANGKIYACPHDLKKVLEYDPTTDQSVTVGDVSLVGFAKYAFAIVASGTIYCVPASATQFLKIDTTTNAPQAVSSLVISPSGDLPSTSAKWKSAALGPDGFIYCVPYAATRVLRFSPVDSSWRLVGRRLHLDLSSSQTSFRFPLRSAHAQAWSCLP